MSPCFGNPHASVYLYGKTTRPERKMGHINVVTSSMQDAESRLSYILGDATEIPKSLATDKESPLVGIIMGSDSIYQLWQLVLVF